MLAEVALGSICRRGLGETAHRGPHETRAWASEGSSTIVQFRTDEDPMVWMHTNIGWVPIGNAPKDDADKAEQFAEKTALSYGLREVDAAEAARIAGWDAEDVEELAEATLHGLAAQIEVSRGAIPDVILAAFPDYRGRTFHVEPTERVTFHDLFWGGGSRNQYAAVHLATGRVQYLAPGVSPWGARVAEGTTTEIPQGFVVVEHAIFMGKDMGLRIYVRPQDVAPLLPAASGRALTPREASILRAFQGLTSAGRKYEFVRMGVTPAELDALVGDGFLAHNRAGATSLTREGKNALARA